jgi:Regulator of chromosome condensation (RCC1) repeat
VGIAAREWLSQDLCWQFRMKKCLRVGVASLLISALGGCGDDPTSAVAGGGLDSGTPPDASCSEPNGCGGCATLFAKAGTTCGPAGATWLCSGTDSLTCARAPDPALDVTATRSIAEHVHVTWSPPATAAPTGYTVRRDAFEIATLDASARAFDDASAEPDGFGAPLDLIATQGTRIDGVSLSWTASAGTPRSHAYEVVAVYGTLRSVPAGPAIGERPAKDVVYELSRDDGVTWRSAGSATTYLDVDAPLGSITAAVAAPRGDDRRSIVHLEISGMPAATPAAPSSYRVRALAAGVRSTPSSHALGFRGVDRVSFQWQRSAGDSDATYSDIPGVTGSVWFDDGAPLTGEGRYYRSTMSAPGASPSPTSAARSASWAVKQIQGGFPDTSCILRLDGSVACWGSSPTAFVVPGTFSELSLSAPNGYGAGAPCLLSTDGTVVSLNGSPPLTGHYKHLAYGGYYSACGIDSFDHIDCGTRFSGDPALPTAAETFMQIAATTSFLCGIRTDGKLRCWGSLNPYSPNTISAGPTAASYIAVSVGEFRGGNKHVCAIRDDHKLSCWGDGVSNRELWAGDYRAVATSDSATCGVHDDGSLNCLGYTAPPSSPDSFVDVSTLERSIAARRADGTVATWYNGIRTNSLPRTEHFRKIAIGDRFSCGIRDSGELACWGANAPGTALAGAGILDVAIVSDSVCVLQSDRTLGCWFGPNPATAPIPGAFDSVTGGATGGNGCALRTDGKVLCWGDNPYRQAPPGPSTDDFKSISLSAQLGCGVRKDDTVACWGGYNTNIQPPSGTFRETAAGSNHACGLRSDKKIVCWGGMTYGPSTSTYEHLSTGSAEVMGLRADGALERLPTGVPGAGFPWPDTFDWVAVSPQSGGCASRRDGHLLCWGADEINGARPVP